MATLKEQMAVHQQNVDSLGKTVDSVVESVQQLDQALSSQEQKLDSLAGSVNETNEKISNVLAVIMRNQHSMDPAEHDRNEYGMAEIVTGPDGSPEVVQSQYQDVDSPEFRDKMAKEAFLKEMVTIEIQESHDPNAMPVFDISVNGRSMIFEPGKQYTVPRYFVEGLARARPVHYGNEEGFNSKGERVVRNPSRRSLRHPFNVIEDTPRGREWLRGVMSQP